MAYYKLNEPFALRSWTDIPCAILDTDSGVFDALTRPQMDALELCNGRIDISNPLIPPALRAIVCNFADMGAVYKIDAPDGIRPYQENAAYPIRYIESAHWSITGKCNYKCKHCCISAPKSVLGEPDMEHCMEIIGELKRCGILNVSLTGGEPLIRPDFLDIVRALTDAGIRITTIYTNGALVNDKLLDALVDIGVRPEFNVSHDGIGWHDWLRGINGAQNAVERTLALLTERGFETGAEMCLHRNNLSVLRESVKRLARIGCGSLKVNPVAAQGEWLGQDALLSLSDSEIFQEYLNYIPQYFADGAPLQLMLSGFFMYTPQSSRYYIPAMKHCDPNCGAHLCEHARMSLYISPECRALPCMSLAGMSISESFPVIRAGNMEKCLGDSTYSRMMDFKLTDYLRHNTKCAACPHALECAGGCRASALSTNQPDWLSPDSSTCLMFKGGWIDRLRHLMNDVCPDIECD